MHRSRMQCRRGPAEPCRERAYLCSHRPQPPWPRRALASLLTAWMLDPLRGTTTSPAVNSSTHRQATSAHASPALRRSGPPPTAMSSSARNACTAIQADGHGRVLTRWAPIAHALRRDAEPSVRGGYCMRANPVRQRIVARDLPGVLAAFGCLSGLRRPVLASQVRDRLRGQAGYSAPRPAQPVAHGPSAADAADGCSAAWRGSARPVPVTPSAHVPDQTRAPSAGE